MSNSSVATIVSTTQQFTRIGNNQLLQSASLASLDNSGQDFLPTLATTYSQVALGAGSGAMVNSPAVEAQTRISKIVARVPKAPLFCLIVANLSLVVLGIILTIYALVASDDNSGEVQARLSVEGLVADRLDSIKSPVSSIEQLFSEKVRGDASKMVFMRTAEGGYTYGLWQGREDEHLTSKPS